MELQGKTVLVTGAGRGIGRAIAQANAAAGAHVVIVARTAAQVEETAAEVRAAGGTATAHTCDVLDLAGVNTLVGTVEAEVGPIDVLINNHGTFGAIGPVWEVDPDDWWTDVEVSVRGTFNMCRAVLPAMIDRGAGRVINLIGGGTAGALPMGSGYSAGKSGVMRLTECVAKTVADRGVVVIAMAPGLVRTAMTEWQMASEVGRKYLPGIADRFAAGDHLPPEKAAVLSVAIGAGRFDGLTGRAVSAWDDIDAVAEDIDRIVADDRRALRLPGFGPAMKPTDD